ncbi:hypothetical protein [Candidatus Vondammii sp. HM_W22]|uniref:hypothetical protein n=1 Tax=Candidatus Vondammii sp. HM_W22 TaxID=2687299 RepID=UPI001F135029|nr:hypothetical protein [Candidatus Vondammii sp. HM_W22]
MIKMREQAGKKPKQAEALEATIQALKDQYKTVDYEVTGGMMYAPELPIPDKKASLRQGFFIARK